MKSDAQDVKISTLVNKDALLLCHKKCGECPYLFATIVASTKILLNTAVIVSETFNMYITSEESLNLKFGRGCEAQ